jgi:uncharacterized protein YbjT (DUF2867 family)
MAALDVRMLACEAETERRPALVVGAAGPVGRAVVERLLQAGRRVLAATRRPGALAGFAADHVLVERCDLNDPRGYADLLRTASADGWAPSVAVLTPILSRSVALLPILQDAGVQRVVAISSHNVSVDARSAVYASLRAAEALVADSGLAWVLIRPTMIYGAPELAGMAGLVRLAARVPVMPAPFPGHALQQPVHYADLARVLAWAAAAPAAAGRAIDVGGPDVVTLHQLYAMASRAAGQSGVTAPVPRWAMALAARVMGPRFPLSPDQIARLDADKHVRDPPDLPEAVRPAIRLEDGLRQLAAALSAEAGATPPHRPDGL